jgi:putative sigma-54 modulation protein
MEIVIQSINFDAREGLKEFIHEKVKKLSNFSDGILSAEVYLKAESTKHRSIGNKSVEIKLLVPQNTLMSSHSAETFEEGVINCTEQLRKQIIKHKEKEKTNSV